MAIEIHNHQRPTEPSPVHATHQIEELDEWDTDGIVITSLGIVNLDKSKRDAAGVESSKPPSPKGQKKKKKKRTFIWDRTVPRPTFTSKASGVEFL